jgi:hypothetical protein
LGPAGRWEIHVTATPEERQQGRASKVEVRGTDVHFRGGVIIALVEMSAEGVDVDTQNDLVQTAAPARLHAEIRADHLGSLLQEKAGGKLQGVKVAFKDGHVVVRGCAH